MTEPTLIEARSAIAEQRFLAFDFGITIEDTDGWQSDTGSEKVSRNVYFANTTGPSTRGYFTVRFLPNSIQVVDEYATLNSQLVGMKTTPMNTYDVTVYCVFKAKVENVAADTMQQAAAEAEEVLNDSGALEEANVTLMRPEVLKHVPSVAYVESGEEVVGYLVDVQLDDGYHESVLLNARREIDSRH